MEKSTHMEVALKVVKVVEPETVKFTKHSPRLLVAAAVNCKEPELKAMVGLLLLSF